MSVCQVRRLSEPRNSDQPTMKQPPRNGSLAQRLSGGELIGTMALRCGGLRLAAYHCVMPPYEFPTIPTFPSHHLWLAIHSIVSYPSSHSPKNGRKTPSELKRPRQSPIATMYPCCARCL